VVVSLNSAEKDWTLLISITAEGNHMIKALPGEFIHRLRTQGRGVDAQLVQYLGCQQVDPCGFGASGIGMDLIAKEVIYQRFGHLGAAGVVGAEEKDSFFHKNNYIRFYGYIKFEI